MIFEHGKWYLECLPEDGARISRLKYDQVDLLTTAPEKFQAPEEDFGKYELRPVYGYDDCFPSVEPGIVQGKTPLKIPDHGELCWLPWQVKTSGPTMEATVESKLQPVRFKRKLEFDAQTLRWTFEVENTGRSPARFLHVMHPLMPLNKVKALALPDTSEVLDGEGQPMPKLTSGDQAARWLLDFPSGREVMLFLQNTSRGELAIDFEGGLRLQINYPEDLFPTLGIWWNNSGYPAEEGLHRNECAFEPVPARTSSLPEAVEENQALEVQPEESIAWGVCWHISQT